MDKVIGFLILVLILPAAVYSQTIHTVGGNSSWSLGVNYTAWASSQTFTIGDTLAFFYDTTHAVDEVTQANFRSCNSANPISDDSTSPTVIFLAAPGTRYFICPRGNHCSQGMALTVNVMATGRPRIRAPSTAATSILNGRNSLIAGFSLIILLFGILG